MLLFFFSLFFLHIKNTLILKEVIEDALLNDKGLAVSGLNAAAFFCRRSKKCRNPFPTSGKIADLDKPAVRLNKMVDLLPEELTMNIALSNIVHGCRKLDLDHR